LRDPYKTCPIHSTWSLKFSGHSQPASIETDKSAIGDELMNNCFRRLAIAAIKHD
jgi:hypothetical protein